MDNAAQFGGAPYEIPSRRARLAMDASADRARRRTAGALTRSGIRVRAPEEAVEALKENADHGGDHSEDDEAKKEYTTEVGDVRGVTERSTRSKHQVTVGFQEKERQSM